MTKYISLLFLKVLSVMHWKPSCVLQLGAMSDGRTGPQWIADGSVFRRALMNCQVYCMPSTCRLRSRYIITRFVFVTFLAREELLLINSCKGMTGLPLYKLLSCPPWRRLDELEERCYQQFINCLRTLSLLSKN